jgi:adenine deaminase
LNTAEHFHVASEVGQIAPGRFADILLVSDLPTLNVEMVIAKGKEIALNGRSLIDQPAYPYPNWAVHSVHLRKTLRSEDFRLPIPNNLKLESQDRLKANVIGIVENQAPTRHLRMEVTPDGDEIKVDMQRDIAKVALVERHRGTGGVQVGLVHGFGFNTLCAVGSTMAHDSHHMVVVGTDEACMALAVNELGRVGGGQMLSKMAK